MCLDGEPGWQGYLVDKTNEELWGLYDEERGSIDS